MSGTRYIALLAQRCEDRAAWQASLPPLDAGNHELSWTALGDRLGILSSGRAILPVGCYGAVIGTVFRRGEADPLRAIEVQNAQAIATSGGEWLIRAHWGSYVAFIESRESGELIVARAPFGDLPCYLAWSRFGLLAASDVELLENFGGYTPEIDWTQLTRQLATAHLHSRATCLKGVTELAGGSRMVVRSSSTTIKNLWQPWDYVGRARRITDRDEAARRVRDAVQLAVRAQADLHAKIVLKLSGGLDSSIVAACLVRSEAQISALTLVTHDPAGDERAYARAVADHLSLRLEEATRDVALIDLERSAARRLPRPVARAFGQSGDRLAANAARHASATAVFDGGGGDNVFCLLRSTAPVVDILLEDEGWAKFWQTARSLGVAAQTSTIEVARRALIRRWTRGPGYRWLCDASLLTPEAQAVAAPLPNHDWLRAPPAALPGSAAHIGLLAAAQSFTESHDPCAPRSSVSPLIAQPVIETCLRIPACLWTRDGHDRAIARDAFEPFLPDAIIDRRDKGAPDSFMGELIEQKFDLVRSMLSEGVLAAENIVDIEAVKSAMSQRYATKGLSYIRLLQLVDAEAWARSWLRR